MLVLFSFLGRTFEVLSAISLISSAHIARASASPCSARWNQRSRFLAITLESLKAVSYLKIEDLCGRAVKLMPFWDGQNWHLWVDMPDGLIEGKIMDTVEGDYVASAAARPSDPFIPFIHLMWQRASWPEICPLISAIADDFHNMGTSVAKLRHFFNFRDKLPGRAASRFASTELEYLVMLCRTVFDLLQEMISITWHTRVQLLDPAAEKRRRSSKLPETFLRLVLQDKQKIRTAGEIEAKFGLPKLLADEYERLAPFFAQLRNIRDNVVHGGTGVGQIFDTERGFCINPRVAPFSFFDGWRPEHYYNENIASVLPWVANTILRTIDACNSLMAAFASVISLPREIAPGYHIFVRGPHSESLAEFSRCMLVEAHGGPMHRASVMLV